jgi:hypothetical protein
LRPADRPADRQSYRQTYRRTGRVLDGTSPVDNGTVPSSPSSLSSSKFLPCHSTVCPRRRERSVHSTRAASHSQRLRISASFTLTMLPHASEFTSLAPALDGSLLRACGARWPDTAPHLTSPRLGRPWQRPASFPTASPEEPWPGCYLYSVHAACLRSVVCAVVRAWRLGSWGRSIYGRVWFAPAECCALNGRWLVVTLLAVGKAEGSLEPVKLLLLQQQQQRCCIALRDGPVSVDATHQLLVSSAYRRCGKSWPCTLVQLPCIRTADWQRRRIGGQCATNASDRDGCAPNDCVDFYECPRLLLEAVPRP